MLKSKAEQENQEREDKKEEEVFDGERPGKDPSNKPLAMMMRWWWSLDCARRTSHELKERKRMITFQSWLISSRIFQIWIQKLNGIPDIFPVAEKTVDRNGNNHENGDVAKQ